MHPLEWIKSKATLKPVETIEIPDTPEVREDGVEPGIYERYTLYFKGTLPARMVKQWERNRRPLENDALTHEVLHLGGQYRSDYGRCEYWHTSYKRVA